MNEQPQNFVSKTNPLAIVCLVSGIVSFLVEIYMFFVIKTDAVSTIPFFYYILGGFLFAEIGSIIGKKALEQIKKSGNIEKGRRLVIIGRVFFNFGVILIVLLFIGAFFTN
jgi:hypothetical protein